MSPLGTLATLEDTVALLFIGIDPETNEDKCPAVFHDRDRPSDAGRGLEAQPDRRLRVGGETPGADAGDHHEGAGGA